MAFTQAHGLFAEPIAQSPYAPELSGDDGEQRRSADSTFWAELTALVGGMGAVVLEEGYVHNASRWHRLTSDDMGDIRARLAPRARLMVWPDLPPDIPAVLASLPSAGLSQLVWQDSDGRITARLVTEENYGGLPALLAGARGAMLLSGYADECHPLLAAVLPDEDGVLRARW